MKKVLDHSFDQLKPENDYNFLSFYFFLIHLSYSISKIAARRFGSFLGEESTPEEEISPLYHNFVEKECGTVSPFFLFFFNPSFVSDFQNCNETLVVSLERSREKEISPLYHNFVEREGGPVSPFFLFFFNPFFVFDFQNCKVFSLVVFLKRSRFWKRKYLRCTTIL